MRTRNASLSAALAATALAVSLPAHAATVSFCGPSSGMGCETGSEQMVFGQAAKDPTALTASRAKRRQCAPARGQD